MKAYCEGVGHSDKQRHRYSANGLDGQCGKSTRSVLSVETYTLDVAAPALQPYQRSQIG